MISSSSQQVRKIPVLQTGIFLLGAMLFLGSQNLSSRLSRTGGRDLIAPPRGIEHFTFGFEEVMADTLWIRAIQDFDYCDHPLNKQRCHDHSWLFQMLDTITDLSPHFRMPYVSGALALSVLISDIDGATRLFDKAVLAFPDDWHLLYIAAYHYLYEVKNSKKAADLLIRSARNGGPAWLNSLANRLYVDSGNRDLAEALLQDMIKSGQDPELIKRMQQKLESIKKKPQ